MIRIPKIWDAHASEITPENIYWNRREFLKKLGLGEREWMAETDAIYKLSNCFRGWVEEDDKVFFGFTFNEPLEKILNDEETTFEDKMSITPKDHRLTDVLTKELHFLLLL